MALMNIFSRRKRLAEKAGQSDVYKYDEIPTSLRHQVIHIWQESIANYSSQNEPVWVELSRIIAKEHGLLSLHHLAHPLMINSDSFLEWTNYFLAVDCDKALDMIELAFRVTEVIAKNTGRPGKPPAHVYGIRTSSQDAIQELNQRFKEEGVGYQYENGCMVRVDSQYIHAEAVKRALSLLAGDPTFAGPEDEFLVAHEHYRHGRVKESIVEALKAFESTMKAICVARTWTYDPKAAASGLIKTLFDNALIPRYLETHFAGLRQMLEAGVPTVRNKTSGHGQGSTPVEVPGYVAAYALHMTATNIVMLVEAHHATP